MLTNQILKKRLFQRDERTSLYINIPTKNTLKLLLLHLLPKKFLSLYCKISSTIITSTGIIYLN